MTPGCTVPWAKNYNPGADIDDGSCIYLQKVGGVCYEFSDIPVADLLSRSFTLSYALTRGWSFYHDYNPDFYFHTRSRFMCLKDGKGYYINEGVRGKYFGSTINPFFIDVIFAGSSALKLPGQQRYTTIQEPFPAMTLDALNWVSEVRASGNNPDIDDQPALYNETITAITIWNNYMTSGKVLLDPTKISLERTNNRNSELKWTMNGFRDIVKTQGVSFLLDIFADYAIDGNNTLALQPWFRRKLIEGKYFIIRFEFDNNNNKQITLHDLDVDVSKSYR
jgi:hypothetical protein